MCVDNGVFDCRLIKVSIKSAFDPNRTSTHHHHFVDVDFKPDGSHHGDQDNQDVDQIDDKDPLCIEDNDNVDNDNDDVVGNGHNDHVDNDNVDKDNVDNDSETSRKCLPNSLYPPIVNNPTQILAPLNLQKSTIF